MNLQNLINPNSQIIKRYMFDILRERFPKHEEIIERIASALVTQTDMQSFGKMIVDVYEVAYFKALEEQKEILKKAGIKVSIAPKEPTPESKPIFKS
jgi:hypothetical protein